MYETFRDCVISSFCLSHCYEWSVLSPGYYKSLDVILVSRVTDPSIPFVIMCEIILSLTFSLLFSYGDKKNQKTKPKPHKLTKPFLYVIIFSLLTQVISYWLEVPNPWFHIFLRTALSWHCTDYNTA